MIDQDRIADLRATMGDAVLREVMALYREEAEAILLRLRPGAAELGADLHALKGCADNVGLAEVACLCRTAERQAPGAGELAAIRTAHDTALAELRGAGLL